MHHHGWKYTNAYPWLMRSGNKDRVCLSSLWLNSRGQWWKPCAKSEVKQLPGAALVKRGQRVMSDCRLLLLHWDVSLSCTCDGVDGKGWRCLSTIIWVKTGRLKRTERTIFHHCAGCRKYGTSQKVFFFRKKNLDSLESFLLCWWRVAWFSKLTSHLQKMICDAWV